MPSKLDSFYRSILFSKYFVKGWGDPEGLIKLLNFRKVISNRSSCLELVDHMHPVKVTRDEISGTVRLIEGYFESPFNKYLPSLLPEESKKSFFQAILPKDWKNGHFKPVCLHMAGTGDHYFWRRRKLMAQPLLKAGIGSVIVENPFYGLRKPKYQSKSVLHNVSDIFVMGGCLILEALVLFYWCRRLGLGPLGVTGLSMGGHMASLAVTTWPEPAVLVPCLSWSTASGVFTKGVMSRSINWEMLASQYSQNDVFRQEIRKMLHSDLHLTQMFRAGQRFAHDFPNSMSTLLGTIGSGSKNIKFEIRNDDNNLYYKVNSFVMEFLKSKFSWTDNNFTLSKEDLSPRSKTAFGDFHDAVLFMRGIMDECTHLKNFSIPIDTSLIISVFAQEDGYVPREGSDITSIWPGAEVRVINTGHIAAFLLYLGVFRQAIIDAFERYKQKYA